MEEEILSNEPAPVEAPAPVVAKAEKAVESAPVVPAPEVEEVVAPAPVEVKEVKAAVQEMVATQEAPAPKPRNNRRRGRPGKKQENSSTK
jgi:hypothetical protein